MHKFGSVRPILNTWHPDTTKLTYWFPSVFIIGFDMGLIASLFGYWQLTAIYGGYLLVIFLDSLFQNRHLGVAILSICTSFIQFFGYGLGFLESKFKIK